MAPEATTESRQVGQFSALEVDTDLGTFSIFALDGAFDGRVRPGREQFQELGRGYCW